MSSAPDRMPSYAQLLARTDAPRGSSWGLFGDDFQRGTLNFIGTEQVRSAVGLVKDGVTINLDLPVNAFVPAIVGSRGDAEHVFLGAGGPTRDDRLDNFYLQSTTQIDGLRHVRHWEHEFYNGVSAAEVDSESTTLGIDAWKDGIVGRGVLLDMARFFAAHGQEFDPLSHYGITVAELDAAAEEQGVSLAQGDILLIRTGWVPAALATPPEDRASWRGRLHTAGLEQSEEMVAWLWDHRIALTAADNVMVERYPVRRDSPFVTEEEARGENRIPLTGMLHRVLIPLLGMPLGEMWDLEELADACAADGRYEFMVSAKPLYLRGGVGSPANAVAIR